jgi:hypothetical protein
MIQSQEHITFVPVNANASYADIEVKRDVKHWHKICIVIIGPPSCMLYVNRIKPDKVWILNLPNSVIVRSRTKVEPGSSRPTANDEADGRLMVLLGLLELCTRCGTIVYLEARSYGCIILIGTL